MSKRIAPTLQDYADKGLALCRVIGCPRCPKVRRELRALLRVARAARQFRVYVHQYSDPVDEIDAPLRKALAALDRAGSAEGGKP